MTLIADSGSSSTLWAYGGQTFATKGMNPMVTTDEALSESVKNVKEWLATHPSKVAFYGAGCGNLYGYERIRKLLEKQFPGSYVSVETDLLGACRATCGNHKGRVGILGTGSNACYYDGEKALDFPPSLGYILGDEGSGNHIGKRLLQDYFLKTMPSNVRQLFQKAYNMEYCDVMKRVYQDTSPNRYIAHFATFAGNHLYLPYLHDVCRHSFETYLDTQVKQVNHVRLPLHLVGGLAYAIAPVIREVCAARNICVGSIVRDPMDGLVEYHRNTTH
ncbi:MAG: hypothetical protein SPJ13_02085 [Bacteroidales bacterium]|nr:hypothetical protein [Bacteroidales bacterium]